LPSRQIPGYYLNTAAEIFRESNEEQLDDEERELDWLREKAAKKREAVLKELRKRWFCWS
jgi:hypothetical protein